MAELTRNIRQKDLVPDEALARVTALVIGVGAVGRQVALQLAAVGVPRMTLVDHDTVGIENVAPQGFWEEQVGVPKTHAVADHAQRQSQTTVVSCYDKRFDAEVLEEVLRRTGLRVAGQPTIAVFCCVDSIDARKVIWNRVRDHCHFFADGRMSGETIRVLASGDPAEDEKYGKTLFPGSEAQTGACTAKTTIYSANVCAGLMLAQFAHHLRGLPVVSDQSLNLFSAEYSAAD